MSEEFEKTFENEVNAVAGETAPAVEEAVAEATPACECCASPVAETPPVVDERVFDAPSGKNKGGLIAWSIINMIFFSLLFGLIALTQASGAKNAATAADEKKKNKAAVVWNIIADVIGLIVIIAAFFGQSAAGIA